MSSRIAVLASGGGSNLQALLDHFDAQRGPPEARDGVVLVASDREAGVLVRARSLDIAAFALDATQRTAGLDALLEQHGIDLLVLAGYLRMVPADVVRRLRGRVLNVHPALLPAFGGFGMYGARVHQAVLAAGARVSGVTVHFVDEQYDHGAIIAQWPVPVFAGDTPESLAARVLRAEHALYPRVVAGVAAGRIVLDEENRVHGVGEVVHEDVGFTLQRDSLGDAMDVLIASGPRTAGPAGVPQPPTPNPQPL